MPRVDHAIDESREQIRFVHSAGLLWPVYKHGVAFQRAISEGKGSSDAACGGLSSKFLL